MSKEIQVLEINKYILSKLWYTSLIICRENNNKIFISKCNNDSVDFVESEALITNLIHSQNENEYQWIIYILLNKFINNTTLNIEDIKKQKCYIQMIYALQLYKNLTINLQQELLTVYKNSLQQRNPEIFGKIQDEYFIFLKQNIYDNPFVTCWILNEFLLTYSLYNKSTDIVCSLQNFYFSLIKDLLEFKLSKQSINNNYFGSILCIISKMNIVEFDESILFEWLFPMILKAKNNEDIEYALYSRTDQYFFKKWCIFLHEIYIDSKFNNNLNHALKIQKILFNFTSTSAPTINKNKLIERISNIKLHWVTDILNICYILIINKKYDDVSLILSCTLLKDFWPVLLFKVLNKYLQEEVFSNNIQKDDFIYDSIEFLISRCNFDMLCNPILNEVQKILRKNIRILKYILNCMKENVKAENLNHNQEIIKPMDFQDKISIKWIFDLLQQFDTLLVLKMTTNIWEQNHAKIKNLLEDICESENIFNAYYIILNALKAILLYNNYDINKSIITSYLSDMSYYIKMLYPLNLRIQVIEDIFCLFFLQYEDFDHTSKSYDKIYMNNSHEESKFENKSIKQQGFICNRYAIKDMLFHLIDIISTTEIECIEMKNKNECIEEIEQIQKNIVFINSAIADAKWRFELYTTSEFIKNINMKDGNTNYQFKSKNKVLINENLISNRSKENIYFYQGDNISDETRTKSTNSSESESIHNSKWQICSKNITLTDAINEDIIHKPLFINFMLATKESLIIRCLWKNDYIKAENIIETNNMKNTYLNGEVQFSKALHTFRENIYKQTKVLKNKNMSPKNLQSSTLENIRLVTQESIKSSRQTSHVETFLVSQKNNLQMSCMEILNNNEILTICALDLALTMSHIYPISKNLYEIAMKYLKLCKTFDNTEYVYFFHKVFQLLYEKKNQIFEKDILCDAKIALCIKEYKKNKDFWTDIMINHQEFKESQANKNTINRILKDGNYLPGLKILSKIVTFFFGSKKYIQNICSHLQLLHSIIPIEHTIFTVSDLLKIPLHYYFGYQIFELKIEPQKLETIAHDLQINLGYSILTNACPRLSFEEDTNYIITNKKNGCIILNEVLYKSDLNYKFQGPNQCVSQILIELLQVLHNFNLNQFYLSQDICKTISKNSDIQTILNKTSHLASLDLSELSMGDETLTFFLNTWNLMFLHAILTVWANHPPFNNLQHTVSLMSIGYLIGDLGLVTLAALRSKLLNNIILNDEFFMQVEELNESAWQDLDITHDSRVIFVMANEFFGTPCIRICKTESLNEDLSNAFHEYLNHYSCYKSTQNIEKQKIILLPEIVERYQTSISQNTKNDLQSNNSNSENLFSINNYFKSSDENIIIQYIPFSYSYNIILKYSTYINPHHKQINQYKSTWGNHSIRSSLLQYLEKQCWIVSYLLQRINNENPTILENSCDNLKRTACLENLITAFWIKELKLIFENNQTLTAIYEKISAQKLWFHLEQMLKENKWNACLKFINALPTYIALNSELQYFRDKILSYIISEKNAIPNAKILQYLYQIKDVYILSQTVLYNVNKWHINICENALLHIINHIDNYKLPVHCKFQLNELLHRVLIFHKMLPYCIIKPNETWYNIAYCTEKIDTLQIIKSLINADKYELCLEWMECQAFSLEIHPSVTQEFLIGLLKSESQNFKQTLKFFQALPLDQSIKLCKNVLKKLESIDSLKFICNYLLKYCKAIETIKYRRTLLGIDILSMLNVQERPLYIHLIKEPLLILEQLLMNCKFESIQKILHKIQDKLNEAEISRSSFDKIIRFYAQKSLDCRVSLQYDSVENKSKNMQYFASETENAEFIMPIVVPTKEEWIPNDKARKCSCCKNVIFSMFNRRHHCRRCGRVICAICSQHRMQVSGYPPSVLVRVCNDCKRQTILQMHSFQGTQSTPSSEIFDYWRLTRDQKHNETIREEFSFEYAPNVSLCLAILNLHSEHKTYTSFLLDCCDEMKRLLEPVSSGKVNPEVDHIVIIKMIHSLLVAAKVKCAKLGLNTGLTHCDRFLSQVDLIASLIQFDCLHLIPSDNLHDRTLIKLRDLLIEKEQWTLALDVSTKAGTYRLDTQGVWATWGKACLKMGYFHQARDKFFHCLDKIQYDNFDDWIILSYPKESKISNKNETQNLKKNEEIKMVESSSKKTEFSKNRPLKDPPLLVEILQILDNLSIYKYVQYPHQYKFNPSQEILNSFGNFKIVNQKQSNNKNTSIMIQNIYYHESIYYLLTYGSYNSILEFFLKHEEFEKCLTFTLENNLEPDLFFNVIYLYCLRNGSIEKLHEAMMKKDSNLLIWKKYLIYVCHSLEKRQYLNILYHLQLFMKDFIRAAMTCIRFYLHEVINYSDLNAKVNFLFDAQKHLESELQIETLNRKRKKSTSSIHSNQGILTMEMEPLEIDKHINTICRQMEITKFLANCEKEERAPIQYLNLFPKKDYNNSTISEIPTLFGNQQQKINLAVLAILCGRNIEEGFGIAFRIMQDYNLPQQKVYSLTGYILVMKNNISAIEQLIKCCHTSGIPNSYIISDYVLTHCIKLLLTHDETETVLKNNIHNLIRLITDIELKINAYIECKQLKAAYLLAVKHSRVQDIRKILKESDRLGQNAIKTICIKWLQQEPKL